MIDLRHGDCLDVLKTLPDNSVDAIVTDPPYGLSFMGKRWDYDVPSVEVWAECLRVLKPGGHLLAFAGTRTQHRMAVRIEDAGFEIRDMIAWLYGSGFPKSLDVSKAIDKAAGAERKVLGPNPNSRPNMVRVEAAVLSPRVDAPITAPATDAARQWSGWGTALKPAMEPITVARKPLIGTVAENVLAHGTGAINVEGCRVATDDKLGGGAYAKERKESTSEWAATGSLHKTTGQEFVQPSGRWPANVIHDGSEEPVALLGDATRFYYCAKASKRDRDEGLEQLDLMGPGRTCYDSNYHEGGGKLPPRSGNFHPTVKPTDLMRYLVRLVTPLGGVILDPFMGSGSTGKAAKLEGFGFIGIEREEQYIQIARARIEAVNKRLDV